ncbi:hypothetical protein [Brevundimonas sp.]|uniref:hypothetical protein n=1 Tax=Brevundimonas sp. TaxID=1871086 RepID=UPI0027E68D4F|nr:hypothetical protein [Brevundimonas sp.]MDQ7814157.1 hypothetical protein [Brevundimonas sp.]
MTRPVPNWRFVEPRRLVVSETGGVVAAVLGSPADGVMLASAHSLFLALDQLEAAAGAVVDAVANGTGPTGDLYPALTAARVAAAQALILATEPTEH